MADESPLTFDEALGAEYRAVRPQAGFEGADARADVARMHAEERPLSGLCISGGGIRSATFALGVIQGLAERGWLSAFDYVSTVSGGGYMGGFLSAWAHRAGGMAEVERQLRRDAPRPGPGAIDPIRHLREYNSYMSPRTGLFSTDVWTMVAIFVRNVLLNWLVLLPLLMAVLMGPRLFVAALTFPERLHPQAVAGPTPDWGNAAFDAISQSPIVSVLLPGVSLLLLGLSFFFTLRSLPGVGGRDHSRYDFAVWGMAPLVGSVLTFVAFDSLYYLGANYVVETSVLPIVGWAMLPCAGAWLACLVTRRGGARESVGLLFGPLSLAILFMAGGLGVAVWVVTNLVLWDPANPGDSLSWAAYVTFGPPLVLLGHVVGSVIFVGLSSRMLKDEDREWLARAMGTTLLFTVVWTGVCAVVLLLPTWAFGWRVWGHGLLAAATAGSAWLSTFAGGSRGASDEGARLGARLLSAASMAAPAVFLALLAGALSVVTNVILVGIGNHLPASLAWLAPSGLAAPNGEPLDWTNHEAVLTCSPLVLVAGLALAFAGISMLAARYVNINTFSMHGMYRDRLARAYLGATNAARRASRFTGFAATDDLPMTDLATGQKPFHVLNLALNLVGGDRLDWQQRKAESFTVTPLHCGSHDVGYRPSSGYGGGITLGTAIAISGAAASPNMGYHSSPAVGAIMTLFNARQGAWLGNPGPAGAATWRHPGPLRAVSAIVREALGQTSDRSEYVYLSDGGHFENLAMYEMVRRRCRLLVVLDGGCDPGFTFDDLGDAIRKIRIDMGIGIEFADEQVRALRARAQRFAVGTIRYSDVDGPGTDGRILYLKPMLLGNESPDVASYAASHAAFPHEPTSNQWFNEAQTESYRALGLHTVDEITQGWSGGPLDAFAAHLERGGPRPTGPAA